MFGLLKQLQEAEEELKQADWVRESEETPVECTAWGRDELVYPQQGETASVTAPSLPFTP